MWSRGNAAPHPGGAIRTQRRSGLNPEQMALLSAPAVVALLETTSQWRARLQEAIAVAQAEFGGLGAGGESAGMPPVLMLHDEALVRLLQQGSELEVTPAQELGQLRYAAARKGLAL